MTETMRQSCFMKQYLPLLMGALMMSHGCDFHPLYGLDSSTHVSLSQIEIGLIPDRIGQRLRNLLYDQFYQSAYVQQAIYHLDVTMLTQDEKVLGLTSEGQISRRQIVVTVTYELRDIENNQTIFAETRSSTTWYNISLEPFGSVVAKNHAIDRALSRLSEQITLQILTFLRQ